jgi:hypothetical protein
MQRRLGVSFLILLAFVAAGQVPKQGIPGPCTIEQAASAAGAWIGRPDRLSELARGKLTPIERKRLEAKAAAALEILRAAYPTPQGHDVWYYRHATRIIEPTLPPAVDANLIFMEYRCYTDYRATGSRLIPEIASDAWVTVSFNSLDGSLNNPLPDGYTLPSGLPMYHTETHLEGSFRGVPVIGGRPERDSTTVYIANKPHLPLRPVTRLELLQTHREYWLKKTHENLSEPAESAVRGLQGTLADLEKRHAGDGAQFEQKRQKLLEEIRGWEERAAKGRAAVADVDRRSAAQLAQLPQAERALPATLRELDPYKYAELRFDGGPDARPVVVVDDDFHAPRPNRAAVQYITVFWRRVPSSAIKERAMDTLLNNLDFNALRALLDR